jgi:hypothetical protein
VAKSKYTPEICKIIFAAIAQTGSDRAAFQAAGINRDTFYSWMKKYPDFSDGVGKARAEYQDVCPENLVQQANKAFADYLYGRVEVAVETEKWVEDEKGIRTERSSRIVKQPPPRWAIERVLGRPLDVLEAIKTLAQAGIIPHHLVQVAADEVRSARERIGDSFKGALPEGDVRNIKPGLSEETAAAIRAHVLGITTAPALPEQNEAG